MNRTRLVPLCLIVLLVTTGTLAEERIRRETADTLLLYQRASGGWPKNYDWDAVDDQKKQDLLKQKQEDDSTIDNSATRDEIRYLAQAYAKYQDDRYRQAALAGIRFLLEAQYDNGAWPQYYLRARGFRERTFAVGNADE